ncbi:MAG: hypothetical protein GC185_04690 [Alphaproteobacteria bacterium]|nr:hypothetical protein [Alphaproteobacteria bacterium]
MSRGATPGWNFGPEDAPESLREKRKTRKSPRRAAKSFCNKVAHFDSRNNLSLLAEEQNPQLCIYFQGFLDNVAPRHDSPRRNQGPSTACPKGAAKNRSI